MNTCQNNRHPGVLVVTTRKGCPHCRALIDLEELRKAKRRDVVISPRNAARVADTLDGFGGSW